MRETYSRWTLNGKSVEEYEAEQKKKQDDEISMDEVRHLVSLIQKGDPDVEGSKKLLRLFCDRAKKLTFPSSPFPPPLLDLIVEAFERYLSGKERDLAKSLGLKRRGRPRKGGTQRRNLAIADKVFRLKERGNTLLANRENANWDGTFETVAQKYGVSELQVRNIYYDFVEQMKKEKQIESMFTDIMDELTDEEKEKNAENKEGIKNQANSSD